MKSTAQLILVGLAAAALTACGSTAAPTTSTAEPSEPSQSSAPTESKELTVVTHDSFVLPEELLDAFAKDTGYTVKYVAPGDSGSLVNQLILTKDSPLGDVVYGIDNSTSTRAVREGIVTDYTSPALPATSEQFAAENLTPIDYGDVCINADLAWYEEHNLEVPTTLDDLTQPQYKDQLVVTSPATSSPGLSFLLATVGAKGSDGYLDYWKALQSNGLKVASGWTEAYYTDFSGADGKGDRPLVLSYSTSPAYTVADDASTTQALLGTCYRQVEYAGVIAGAQNEVGAQKFIDFLLSPQVQEAIPTNMYMYPAELDTKLPEEWTKFAPLSSDPIEVDPALIDTSRETWIRDWSEAIG